MISPNMAGLLVFAVGAILALKWKSDLEPGPALTAMRTRGVGWALLAAVATATMVSVFQLREAVDGSVVTMPVPVGPVKTVGREFVPHRLTALLVREHDGRVMRAWETVQRSERDGLVVDSEYLESRHKTTKRLEVRMCSYAYKVGDEFWHLGVRDTEWGGAHFSMDRSYGSPFGKVRAYKPELAGVLSDTGHRKGNLFSLITPGAYYHLVFFAAPESSGVGFERRDANAVMAELDWKHPQGYVRPNEIVGGSAEDLAEWKAVRGADVMRERDRAVPRSGYQLMPGWVSSFGWAAGFAFFLVPFFLTAGKSYRAARWLFGCVAMLMLAVVAERLVAARWLSAPMYSHFFTRSEG